MHISINKTLLNKMKLVSTVISLTLLFNYSAAADPSRKLGECEDSRGKFRIPELVGINSKPIRNCQYVSNNKSLCETSKKVKRRCPATCGTPCEHHHSHSPNEHLQMTCDANDELLLEHIQEVEIFCALVVDGATKCRTKCAQPMSVLHLFYRDVCPEMEKNETYEIVAETGLCHDDHDHFQLPKCDDKRGKFAIEGEDKGRNCQYVRNQALHLCDNPSVRRKCRNSCGLCS